MSTADERGGWPDSVVEAVIQSDGCASVQDYENPCDGLYGCHQCIRAMLDDAAPAIFAAELRRRVAAMGMGTITRLTHDFDPDTVELWDSEKTLHRHRKHVLDALARALGVEAPDGR